MRSTKYLVTCVSTLAVLCISGESAFAQTVASQGENSPAASDNNAENLDAGDIVVTAQKRNERLSDVPMSIVAASAEQLQSRGVANTDDLAKLVPGFSFQKSNYGLPIYYIRGVGFSDTTLGVSPAVTVYVDQIPLPFSPMSRGRHCRP